MPICISKYRRITQNDDNYCLLWCILAHLHEVDIHLRRVSNHERKFYEINQGDKHFPMKIKDIPTFQKLNILNINVFKLSSFSKKIFTRIYQQKLSRKTIRTSILGKMKVNMVISILLEAINLKFQW